MTSSWNVIIVSFPKILSARIRAMRENQRIIRRDARIPSTAWGVCRQPVRVTPSQTWRTFLRNHAAAIAAIDLCVVPTLTFECLFAFLVLGHDRRQLLWFAVTRHPTAEWLAQQLVEAFPWGTV